MAMTKERVQHVASLARLALSESEQEQLTKDLGHILAHVDQLNEVDTKDVPPTEYIAVQALPLRQDEARHGLTQDEALEGAPRVLNEGFRVPAFVEE